MSKRRNELWDRLTPERLPGDIAEIARALGMDAARYLITNWGGTQIYIHTEESVLRPALRDVVKAEWNGANESALASDLGVSRRMIQEAVRLGAVPDPSQADLFGAAGKTSRSAKKAGPST